MARGATATERAGCVICGCRPVEQNHVGGRNHVAWFTVPFCIEHHNQFHALLHNSRVDLEYTPDPRERMLRALKALQVGEWMLLEAFQELHNQEKANVQRQHS